MAFWAAKRDVPLPFSVKRAVYCLAGYGVVTLGYSVWLGLAAGFSGDELILGGVRVGAAAGLAFALFKLQAWARYAAFAAAGLGGVGLAGAAMTLASGGLWAFPLGPVGAAYSLLSTALLIVPATFLARGDARAAFVAPAAPAA